MHDLIIDRKIKRLLEEGKARDDSVYFFEKDCYVTPKNATPDTASKAQEPHYNACITDCDVAEFRGREEKWYFHEIKSVRGVPEHLTEKERQENFDLVNKGQEQLSDITDNLERVAATQQIEIPYSAEVEIWDDVFDNSEHNVERLPEYEGSHYCSKEAYEIARDSEVFEAVDEGMFRNRLLMRGERVRRKG